jgi:hypothetical protein
MSLLGTTRTSRDVRFRAAVRGIADIKCALIRAPQFIADDPVPGIPNAPRRETAAIRGIV